MLQLARSLRTFLLLAGLAFPWIAGVASLAHDLDGHHHHAGTIRDSIELVVHGHHHDPGTPDHQHAFVLARLAPASGKVSLIQDATLTNGPAQRGSSALGRTQCPRADLGHGPPHESHTIQILRI